MLLTVLIVYGRKIHKIKTKGISKGPAFKWTETK